MTNIKHEDPLDLDDVIRTDSAEENEFDSQDDEMDPEAADGDIEHEEDDDYDGDGRYHDDEWANVISYG